MNFEFKNFTSSEIRKLYDELYQNVLQIFDAKVKELTNYDETFDYQIDWIDATNNGFLGSFYVKLKNQPTHSETYQYIKIELTFNQIDEWKKAYQK